MKVIEQVFNGYSVYVEVEPAEVDIVFATPELRDTQLTGISDTMHTVYASLRQVLTALAEDVGSDLRAISKDNRPERVELEFNLAISSQAGPVWIISSSGKYSMKVSMSWKLHGAMASDEK